MNKPTFVSLFSGAGGLDLGLISSGFRLLASVESNDDCIATLEANHRRFGDPELIHDDIANVSKISARNVDLLCGGPPCQPFSSCGKQKGIVDDRGKLFEHFVRIADELRPKAILFENVRGLVTARGPSGQPGEVVSLVKEAFESIGYATTFALLNAADFGVPQRRVRCFMMATRNSRLPEFPIAKSKWISLGSFLKLNGEPIKSEIVYPSSSLAEELAAIPDGKGIRSAGKCESTRPGGHWGYRQGCFIADLSLPARTVVGSPSQDWVRCSFIGKLRRLTQSECAALQGFPVGYEFLGNVASRFKQIGNAVPSEFGRVLGNSILKSLSSPGKPKSAALPLSFTKAIEYTKREQLSNGTSREFSLQKSKGKMS